MTTTTTPMTDEQIRDLKDHADALTRAIEADFELPYNAPSAHSLAYWLRSAVGVSRQTLNAVAEVERLRAENARLRQQAAASKASEDILQANINDLVAERDA